MELGKDGLTVLLVSVTEPRETVAQAVAARGYGARVLLDTDGRVTEAYRVQATPTVYLIGRDGKLIAQFSPRTRPDDDKLLDSIKTALAN
jgi:peroxiredoxin